MIKCLSAFLLCLFISNLSKAGSVYVGNGGEGIKTGSALYLRDLYDFGNYLHPQFGQEVDPEIKKRLSRSSLDFPSLSMDLLAQKLTDLQRLSPNLGFYVLEAILYHRWIFIEDRLNPVPDDGSPMRYNSRPVPLANRFQGVIRVDREAWQLLPESHKVALIIHEAIFSYLRPEKIMSGKYRQPASVVRDLVGLAFTNPNEPGYKLSREKESLLIIPTAEVRRSCQYGSNAILMTLGDSTFSLSEAGDKLERNRFIAQFCTEQHDKMASGNPLSVTFTRDPYRLIELSYKTSRNGHVYWDNYLGAIDVPSVYRFIKKEDWEKIEPQDCSLVISAFANTWFSYGPGTLSQDPIASCEPW